MFFCDGTVSHVGGKVLLATELAFLQSRETKVHIGMEHTISNANDHCQWRRSVTLTYVEVGVLDGSKKKRFG